MTKKSLSLILFVLFALTGILATACDDHDYCYREGLKVYTSHYVVSCVQGQWREETHESYDFSDVEKQLLADYSDCKVLQCEDTDCECTDDIQ